MLRIRLRRPGKSVKRRYHYRIVVSEKRTPRESKFVKELGHYDPSRQLLKIDIDAYEAWVKKGAQPTDTVRTLFKRYTKQLAGLQLKKRKPKSRGKKKKQASS